MFVPVHFTDESQTPLQNLQAWAVKDGTAYVVTYGGTPEEFDSSLPAFQSIVDSFSLEKQCCHYRETKKRIRIVGGGVKITSENCDGGQGDWDKLENLVVKLFCIPDSYYSYGIRHAAGGLRLSLSVIHMAESSLLLLWLFSHLITTNRGELAKMLPR